MLSRTTDSVVSAQRFMETRKLNKEAQANWSYAISQYPGEFAEFVSDLFAEHVEPGDTLIGLARELALAAGASIYEA